MQMHDIVSKGFVFTSLTALEYDSATLFLSHIANTSFKDLIRNLPYSSECYFKFQVKKEHDHF